MIFRGFLLEKGKNNFGLGDEAKFLKSSSWGRVGNEFYVLYQMKWIEKTTEELKRERECKDPLQTEEEHVKLNKSFMQSTSKSMNSTSITHLFNSEA